MATTKPISGDVRGSISDSGEFSSNLGRAIFQQRIESVLLSAKEATGADGVAVSLKEDGAYVCRASIGDAPEIGVRVEPGQGICGRCVAEAQAVVEQELEGEIKSVAAVPVMREGKTYGFVAGFSLRVNAFSQSAIEEFHRLAEAIHTQVEPIVPIQINPEAKDADDDLMAQLGIVPDGSSHKSDTDVDDSFLTDLVRDVLQESPTAQAVIHHEAHDEPTIETPNEETPPAFPSRTTEEVLMQIVEHTPAVKAAPVSSTAAAAAPAPLNTTTETKKPVEPPPTLKAGKADRLTRKQRSAMAAEASKPAIVSAPEISTPEVTTATQTEGEPWTLGRMAIVAVLLLAVLGGGWYYVRRQRTVVPAPQKTIAATTANAPDTKSAAALTGVTDVPAPQPSKTEQPSTVAKKTIVVRQPILVTTNGGPSRSKAAADEAPPVFNGASAKLSAPVLPSGSTDVVFGGKRSTGAIPAKLLQRVEPIYPTMARSMRVAGAVKLEATVGVDGRVISVRKLDGNDLLANAAENAVRRWRYEPAKQNGNKVESVVEIIFNFR